VNTPLSEEFVASLRKEFPNFRIVDKRGNTFSRCIDIALKLVTFGAQDRYLTEYHTVIGNTLYVPESYYSLTDVDRVILLRHERVHLRQRRRLGFAVMAFVYLVPFFPLGLAYGRARIEWEAYRETIRATAEFYGLAAAGHPSLRNQIVTRFTGADYGWMWPFRGVVERWYDEVLTELSQSPSHEGASIHSTAKNPPDGSKWQS
jgi:hypothetical protein